MTEKELRYLEALQKIGRELAKIRGMLEAAHKPKKITDLESYFEQQEDDRK